MADPSTKHISKSASAWGLVGVIVTALPAAWATLSSATATNGEKWAAIGAFVSVILGTLGVLRRKDIRVGGAGGAAGLLFALCLISACASSPQTASTPSTVNPRGELGQSSTRATAAFLKSVATTDAEASVAPEARAVGAEVTVPFALWNPETKSWQIPLDAAGLPYKVHATAVRDFTYIVGTVTNNATVSGTASGSQTQGGQAGATSGQTATPTNTTTTNPTITPR